LQGLF